MRSSSVVLIALAFAIANSSGCKLGSKLGLSNSRMASRTCARRVSSDRSTSGTCKPRTIRGASECDCYACRIKNQEKQRYVIEPAYEPFNNCAPSDCPEQQTILAPVVDATMEQQDSTSDLATVEPASEETPPVQPDSNPEQSQREIQGQIIENSTPDNLLPAQDNASTAPIPQLSTEPQDQLDVSPEVEPAPKSTPVVPEPTEEPTLEIEQSAPTVESTPIENQETTSLINKVLPQVKQSAFKINRLKFESQSAPTANDSSEKESTKPRRGHSIWFAPVQQPTKPTENRSSPQAAPDKSASRTMVPSVEITREETAATTIVPFIEHEIRSTKKVATTPKQLKKEIEKEIVLQARPVDQHMIYNGRSTHAPVREARLRDPTQYSQYAMSHRQPTSNQNYFQPLPPTERRWRSPAPAPMQALPATGVQANPRRAQQRQNLNADSSELRLEATTGQSFGSKNEIQTQNNPIAKVIKPNSAALKLNAITASETPQTLPSIVSIQQGRRDQVVVGSFQTPGVRPSDIDANNRLKPTGNRLHTSPWRPMKVEYGTEQVSRSIKNLMIKPQQEANFATDGIHR